MLLGLALRAQARGHQVGDLAGLQGAAAEEQRHHSQASAEPELQRLCSHFVQPRKITTSSYHCLGPFPGILQSQEAPLGTEITGLDLAELRDTTAGGAGWTEHFINP